MSKPPLIQTDVPSAVVTEPEPAALRLVLAFMDAVGSSPRRADIFEEAFEVESLLIAAVYSLEAWLRFNEHWHQGVYNDPPVRSAGSEPMLLDGYDAWIFAADLLLSRMTALRSTGFEPGLVVRFQSLYEKARGLWADARDRETLDREAVRVDRLASLASKVKPLQTAYDDEGPPS
jgi:hypothetical protein